MLTNMKQMLLDAEKNHYAIASINTPNLMSLRAVVEAAEALDCPIIINHAQGEEPLIKLELIAPFMREFADKAKVPVAMHIDHGHDIDFLMRALRLGFTSMMYDRSEDPLDLNIQKVKEFISLVRPLGISVEGELGAMPNNMPTCVPGQEKSDLTDLSVYYTKVEEAKRFVDGTDVDVMTISFGTVHGIYEKKSNLDIDRVRAIHKSIEGSHTHLGMHGASGTVPDQLQKAIAAGIRKINYYTGMDTCATQAIQSYIEEKHGKNVNFSQMPEIARIAMYENCKKMLNLFMNL